MGIWWYQVIRYLNKLILKNNKVNIFAPAIPFFVQRYSIVHVLNDSCSLITNPEISRFQN